MDLDNPIGDINQLQLKLYQKLSHRFEKFNLANNQLRNKIEIDNQKLNKNNYDINDSIRQLQMINIQSDDNIKILTNNINILEKNCDYLNQLPEITINNLSFDKNKLYKQLVQLIAEENAFEDTYHELSMALSSQRITSKVYFKNVRTLARDQFMVRALIVKIKEKLFIP
ncbi:hypothetical protein K502DRAFT_196352 [Neoconidiobolus thromboides FSU 785]|nr:hypothetical protein K502DRAFT_196352 [Neoconidiobolus thromboides FSU 785]